MSRQTDLLGTLRNNRVGNLKEVIAAKIKRNETFGWESSGIVVAKWKAKRVVRMLSTRHDLKEVSTGEKKS